MACDAGVGVGVTPGVSVGVGVGVVAGVGLGVTPGVGVGVTPGVEVGVAVGVGVGVGVPVPVGLIKVSGTTQVKPPLLRLLMMKPELSAIMVLPASVEGTPTLRQPVPPAPTV